ncbi:MAG: DUF169 domain-containing protein [Candidatus Methanoperedens sp.]|nr:DUF169 domain-containing protein [Candidatus Methanoperedens sp.]
METTEKKYTNFAERMVKILGLKGSPVAIALKDEIPPGLEKGAPARHCEMVQHVRQSAEQFYSTLDDHKCKGGAAVIGLAEIPENVANGDYYYKLGAFASTDASRNTMEFVPRIEKHSKYAIYSPLGSANFSPDLVVVLCTPKQAMQMVQADLYTAGGRIQTGFAGKQSLCGDIVANTINTNSVQVSLGCSGSRKHAKIDENELIVGIPIQRVEQMVDSLEKLFEAPK